MDRLHQHYQIPTDLHASTHGSIYDERMYTTTECTDSGEITRLYLIVIWSIIPRADNIRDYN